MIDPRLTAVDLDETNAETLVRQQFGAIGVMVRVRPNFLTIEIFEPNDSEPTIIWVAAADLLATFGELGKKHAN